MAKPKHKFERLADHIYQGTVLTAHLEKALLFEGEGVWPTEYAIHVNNKERVADGYFHPSSHADAPDLLLYYLFHPKHDVPAEWHSVDELLTFQIGSAYHAVVQSMLINLGFTTAEECEVSFLDKKRWCSGTLDIRKLTLPDGRIFPVEIKSAAYLPREPWLKYIKQFQVYMDLGCGEPQEEGILLYIEKGSPHRFREFVIRRDEKLLEDIYARWRRVLQAIAFSDPTSLPRCHVDDEAGMQRCPARGCCMWGNG